MNTWRISGGLKLTGNLANNWKTFLQSFDEYLSRLQFFENDDSAKLEFLFHFIGSEAVKTYNTFGLTTEDAANYESVIKAFADFCQPKENEVYDSFMFHNRKQQENESFDDFLMDLKKLVLTCNFEEPDRMIRDSIVRGVRDKILQKRLFEAKQLDMAKAIGMARVAEAESRWNHNHSERTLSIVPASLVTLNEYCLLDLFEFLQLEDAFNLAETCDRLEYIADRSFKRHSRFKIDSKMLKKGDQYINRIFKNIGLHILSLCVDFAEHRHFNLSKIVDSSYFYCENLKGMRIERWEGWECEKGTLSMYMKYPFQDVEMLTLDNSNFGFIRLLMEKFDKLKFFNFLYSKQTALDREWSYWSFDQFDGLKKVFQNNPNIESFVCSYSGDQTFNFDCRILQLIPKVERLFLESCSGGFITELNSLAQLNQLTKLHIQCNQMDIMNLLRELAKKGILEELELERFKKDENFWDLVKSFDKLQLLVITKVEFDISSPIVWPTKLKLLHLNDCCFTHSVFLSTVRQLRNLQSIKFCYTESCFDDGTKLAIQILSIIGDRRGRRLDVIIWNGDDYASWGIKKYIFVSHQLRILDATCKHLDLQKGIHFPDHYGSC